MKAVTYHRYGTADDVRIADVDRPAPAAGEVLIRVRAASINHGDLAFLHGRPELMRLATGVRRPRQPILGRAVAGTVESVGSGVTSLEPGTEVFGESAQRGFAEYTTIRADRLVPIPAGVTVEQAATLPIAGTTAIQAIRRARLAAGQSVLINGASGGVGTFAVQLAAALGATVTAVCSTRNADQARTLGAAKVVDYTSTDFTRTGDRYDTLIDLVGSHRIADYRRALTPTGTYVASTANGVRVLGPIPRQLAAAAISPFVGQRLTALLTKHSTADLRELAGMVAAGTLNPVIERTYPLSQAAEALRHAETTHARGKLLLIP